MGGCANGIATAAPPEPPAQVQAQGGYDIGSQQDVKAVKQAIRHKFPTAGNVAISHNWALGRGFTKEDAVSVLLHKVNGHLADQGLRRRRLVAPLLEEADGPAADAQNLVRVYQ